MERNTNLPPEHLEVIKKQYSFGMIRHLCEEIERLRAENTKLRADTEAMAFCVAMRNPLYEKPQHGIVNLEAFRT